jgi:AraC-like DNA-binding protein
MRTRQLGRISNDDRFIPIMGDRLYDYFLGDYPQATHLAVHMHSGLEFGLTLAGRVERRFEDYSFQAGPGKIWLIAEWEPHGWAVLEPGTQTLSVHFAPAFLGEVSLLGHPWQNLFRTAPALRPGFLSETSRKSALALGQELSHEFRAEEPGKEDLIRLDMLRLFALLLRSADETRIPLPAPKTLNQAQERIAPALALLDAPSSHDVSIEQAAAACQLSRSQFCSIFQKATGISFGRYQDRLRIQAAVGYLLHSGYSIDAIAVETGFSSASHLHRMFKKFYGCTPGEFRHRNHNSPAVT